MYNPKAQRAGARFNLAKAYGYGPPHMNYIRYIAGTYKPLIEKRLVSGLTTSIRHAVVY